MTAAPTCCASGVWNFTPTGLADGQHTVVASETNAAGQTGSASLTFTLDTTSTSGSTSNDLSGGTTGTGTGATTGGSTSPPPDVVGRRHAPPRTVPSPA